MIRYDMIYCAHFVLIVYAEGGWEPKSVALAWLFEINRNTQTGVHTVTNRQKHGHRHSLRAANLSWAVSGIMCMPVSIYACLLACRVIGRRRHLSLRRLLFLINPATPNQPILLPAIPPHSPPPPPTTTRKLSGLFWRRSRSRTSARPFRPSTARPRGPRMDRGSPREDSAASSPAGVASPSRTRLPPPPPPLRRVARRLLPVRARVPLPPRTRTPSRPRSSRTRTSRCSRTARRCIRGEGSTPGDSIGSLIL